MPRSSLITSAREGKSASPATVSRREERGQALLPNLKKTKVADAVPECVAELCFVLL